MKKYFLTGLVTLLPVTVTIWIFIKIIHFLTKPFVGLATNLLHRLPHSDFIFSARSIRTVSEIIILLGLIFGTFFIGLIARRYFFDQLLKLGDKILYRIPLVNKVYKTSKEIVQSFFGSQSDSFKQVVLLPFPYKGSYCLGLISSASPETCSEAIQSPMQSVFIPTTPNPTTGFLVMVPKEDLIYLDMKTDEAIKYVVSCAVIIPPNPKKEPN